MLQVKMYQKTPLLQDLPGNANEGGRVTTADAPSEPEVDCHLG